MSPLTDDVLANLQASLRPLQDAGPVRTIVILQSLDVAPQILDELGTALPAYEERGLYLLLALRRPHLRVVLVTSVPVPDAIIDYELGLIGDPAELRERLVCLAADDTGPEPLAAKLLARPGKLAELRAAIGDPVEAFIAPFNVGHAERELAVALGVAVYGPDARFYDYGTKSGGRQLFADEGVAHPAGFERIATLDEVADAIARLRAANPALRSVVVKLNDSVYGEGNVVIDLDDPTPLADRLDPDYLERLAADPGIVEEMIVAAEIHSPSVQLRILAGGTPGLVATHDQLLGGPHGQQFIGCTFPAAAGYAPAIVAEAEKVRARLAREGVVGRFGVDFVVGRDADGEWDAYAVEINLREGGTSHPFGALYLLTGAHCSPDGARCTTADGQERCYVASDDIEDPRVAGLGVDELLAAVRAAGLDWDPAAQTGVVLHMLHALEPLGRIGATAIGADRAEAQALFDRTAALVHEIGEGR